MDIDNIKNILIDVVNSKEAPFCNDGFVKICEDSLEYIKHLEKQLLELYEYSNRRLKHANNRVNNVNDSQQEQFEISSKKRPDEVRDISDVFGYYGGWELGYWKGKVDTLENFLMILKNDEV